MKKVIGYKTKIVEITDKNGELIKRMVYIPIYRDLGPYRLTTVDTNHFRLTVDKSEFETKD